MLQGSTGHPKCIARTQKSAANAASILRLKNLPVSEIGFLYVNDVRCMQGSALLRHLYPLGYT